MVISHLRVYSSVCMDCVSVLCNGGLYFYKFTWSDTSLSKCGRKIKQTKYTMYEKKKNHLRLRAIENDLRIQNKAITRNIQETHPSKPKCRCLRVGGFAH